MKLIEVTWGDRNDFNGVLQCEHCAQFQYMTNGYRDERFMTKVIPAIKCVMCGRRGNEMIPSGISDPGTQGGVRVHKVQKTIEVWEVWKS